MPDWACTSCGVINLEGQRACESCGHERKAATAPAPAITTPVSGLDPCGWQTSGRPCQLLATIWVQPTGNYEFNKFGQVTKVLRPGYCAWHYECLSSPRLQDDFDEFDRLHTYWLKRPYCNQFVHHPASYVWSALRGIYREKADRMTVTPCNAHDCYVPDLLGLEPDGPPISPAEARVKVRELVQMLSRSMTPRPDAADPGGRNE